jgi:hypothetical protein
MDVQGRPPLGRHGIIKSTLLEGSAAPPPWSWCLLGNLCFLCAFWLVTRQLDSSCYKVAHPGLHHTFFCMVVDIPHHWHPTLLSCQWLVISVPSMQHLHSALLNLLTMMPCGQSPPDRATMCRCLDIFCHHLLVCGRWRWRPRRWCLGSISQPLITRRWQGASTLSVTTCLCEDADGGGVHDNTLVPSVVPCLCDNEEEPWHCLLPLAHVRTSTAVVQMSTSKWAMFGFWSVVCVWAGVPLCPIISAIQDPTTLSMVKIYGGGCPPIQHLCWH